MADPNGCSPECDGWRAAYDACAASGDPLCEIPDFPACDVCIETANNGQYGCRAETFACGADHTGCVTCNQWLGGADPQGLCPSIGGPPDSIDPAIALSDCACACVSCASACTLGYFDPTAAGFTCGFCIGSTCSAKYGACAGS